ncbi:MAG: pentapeptide repeat-containing protein [Caulobacterales bacterium]|jgi:uncharacterized protein YjbI with pentapeptide repeats
MLKQLVFAALAAALALPAAAQDPVQIAAVQKGRMDCAKCNLFQADFSYTDMHGRNFAGARLRQSELSLTEFDNANLSGVNLSIANAFGARLAHANLSGADLKGGVFVGAYFGGANLKGAQLTGANFAGAELETAKGLTQAQLNTACGDATTTLPTGLKIPNC